VPFLRPYKMVKIGLIGLKDDREALLTTLHDLNVEQIEPIGKSALEHLEPERGSDTQRAVADLMIRFRGLKTALPAVPDASVRSFADLEELLAVAKTVPIDDEVGSLKREEDGLLTEQKSLNDEIDLLGKHPYYVDRLEYLHGSHIVSFFGEGKREAFEGFRAELPSDVHLVIGSVGEVVTFLAAVPTPEADTVGRSAQTRQITLTAAPRLSGTPDQALPLLTTQRDRVAHRLTEIRARLTEISRAWYPTVLCLEEALTIENRKLEVYTKLGAGTRTFALEGWVPVKDRPRLESELTRVTQGRIHVYNIPTSEEPPTLMDNPPGIRWYEFFIKFYSLPQATEWDPTWVFAIVFPLFFGLMLGDWGYGLVILTISVWMTQGFPGARHLPGWLKGIPKMIMGTWAMRSLAYALIPGCIVAIVAGVVFNSFFGAHILPIPYTDPVSAHGAATLLLLAGIIGLLMVTFGFALGALKEYFHHHYRGAIAKLGGIAFAWGVAVIGLRTIRHQVPGIPAGGLAAWAAATPLDATLVVLLVVGFAALIVGEGGMALLGLIEIVSHILSYTRLVGILLASVVLTVVAFKVESLLAPVAFPVGLIGGIVVVIVIELFNIILGVFEPGIQGARLIFVENFSKYFSGNGKAFHPFGSRRQHTLPHRSDPPTAPPPAPTS
jgi:V/A-type H+/Na+-transporting ATPase subunit I